MRQDSKSARRKLILLLKLLAAVAAITWLVVTDRLSFRAVASADLHVLVWALVPLVFINLAAQALRWYCLLRSQGLETRLLNVLGLAWIGNFWATVSPGGLGGEVARGYLIWRGEPRRKSAAVVSVVADRVLGLVGFLVLSAGAWCWLLIGGGWSRATGWVGALSVALLLLAVGLFVALWWSDRLFVRFPVAIQQWAAQARRFVSEAVSCAPWVIAAGSLTLLAAGALVASFSVAALSLGAPLELRTGFLVVPHLVIANSVPISPGGVGVGEAAASLLFQEMGRSGGAELMLLVRAVIYLLRLPGALVLFIHKG